MSSNNGHWDPLFASLTAARKDLAKRARRIAFSHGLDTSVIYYTIVSLAAKAGVGTKVVRYALAKKRLAAARRQPGRAGVLIHPDEGDRWLAERSLA